MAKAASKYISFDTAGNFVSEFADGPAAPEATEDGSLKSAVSYALDAIVEAAGTLPDTAAALVGARAGATHRDPEEKVADVSEHVRCHHRRRLRRKCGDWGQAPGPRHRLGQERPGLRGAHGAGGPRRRLRHGGQPLAGRLRPAHAAHAQPGQHHGRCGRRHAFRQHLHGALGGQGLRRLAHLPRQRQGAARRGRLFPAPRRQTRPARVRSGDGGHAAHRLGGAFARRQHDGALRGALGVGAGASAACRRR